MGRLVPISLRELIRRLKELGFVGPHFGGPHPYLTKGKTKLAIPNEHGSVLSVDLVRRILRRAGVSVDDWLQRND